MSKQIKTSKDYKVAIIGYGYVGKAYHKMFPGAVIYDEPQIEASGDQTRDDVIRLSRLEVNECDLALICVPTDLKQIADGYDEDKNLIISNKLDMSIVEDVVSWLETPLILIKSALQPGTVDRLVAKTGKNIAVSVEFVGMGNYYIDPSKYPDPKDPTKHQMIIVGGEEKAAEACAEFLWKNMSPDVKIHLTSALEAEITKLVENFYGAFKVTFINTLMTLAQKSDSSFIKIHQAWQSDPRTDSMHIRAISKKRGWKSHCWEKDPYALASYAQSVGATDMARLVNTILELNEEHLKLNEED